jgi:alpha-mannosidase
LSRRHLLKAAAATGAALATRDATAQDRAPAPPQSRVFYYVDGYHGGVDGHMPPDSLRNVLDGLDKFPTWKVSFEIEPYSWAVFAKNDPASIERLRKFLADATPAGRVEIVSGAYGQPYAWNASGESNIRQIAYGLEELRAVFPGIVVDTYAVQEPCWTSCLPQLLKSFGYRRAVLKNSTCWGGYPAPMVDADLVDWVGPDGSSIPAVPRYAVEGLVPPATTQGSQPSAAFIDRCVAAGIQHPAGTTLQDMGWPGRPWRFGMDEGAQRALRHVTWRQYADTIAAPPAKQWKASQEDLRVGLPWGASVLQRIAQIVRASENALVRAEKLATMAFVRRDKAFPADELKQAWKLLLWSQHHDVWIVSYNRHKDGTWASAADAKFEAIQSACAKTAGDAAEALAPPAKGDDAPGACVRVFNATGFGRRDLASLEVAGDRPRVLDARGQDVTCQWTPGPAADHGTLTFPADVPAMGYATYRLEAGPKDPDQPAEPLAFATKYPDDNVVLATDLYEIHIDAAKGGRISGLRSTELDREFVDHSGPRSFHEFRGYFPSEGKWLTTADAPAEVRIIENGPLRVTAEIRATLGEWPVVTRVTATGGSHRIDFQTRLELPVDEPPFGRNRRQPGVPAQPGAKRFRVGEPPEPGQNTIRSNRRPFYDSSFKLQVLFPTRLKNPTLDKNAPFDVCRSTVADTRFNAWDAIKHNVVFNWLDLLEEGGAAGLAVFTDHVTSYALAPGEPLGLVVGYAGPGIWHDYGQGRVRHLSYSIVPHAGDWAKARLWRELAQWSEPLFTRRCAAPLKDDSEWSMLDASETGIDVTAALIENGDVLIRLFNAEADAAPARLTLDRRVRRVRRVELDGRVVEDLAVERAADGAARVTVEMGRFAVRTLRCTIG